MSNEQRPSESDPSSPVVQVDPSVVSVAARPVKLAASRRRLQRIVTLVCLVVVFAVGFGLYLVFESFQPRPKIQVIVKSDERDGIRRSTDYTVRYPDLTADTYTIAYEGIQERLATVNIHRFDGQKKYRRNFVDHGVPGQNITRQMEQAYANFREHMPSAAELSKLGPKYELTLDPPLMQVDEPGVPQMQGLVGREYYDDP
jgi:hypothetical protein